MSEWPECDKPDDCKFSMGAAQTTLMYFAPILNRKGENLNPDRNTTTQDVHCTTCHKRWVSRRHMGETTWKQNSPPKEAEC